MKAVFQDLEDDANELNGTSVGDAAQVHELLARLRRMLQDREPFCFELVGNDGSMLTIGIAPDVGSVQHGRSDGGTPYLMAINEEGGDDGFREFLAGGTPTPISNRYCLPIELLERIVAEYASRGVRSSLARWEEI